MVIVIYYVPSAFAMGKKQPKVLLPYFEYSGAGTFFSPGES